MDRLQTLYNKLLEVDEKSVEEDVKYIEALNKLGNCEIKTLMPTFNIRLKIREVVFAIQPHIKNNNQDYFYEALKKCINIIEEAYNSSRYYEEIPKMFLTEESYSFGFKPLEFLIDSLVNIFDETIYPNEGKLFEWFVWENSFGKSKHSIYEEHKTYVISSSDDLIEYIKEINR